MKNFDWGDAREFCEGVFGDDIMKKVAEYIAKNCVPVDIFNDDALREWAQEQSAESIYGRDYMENWAIEHGYVETDET